MVSVHDLETAHGDPEPERGHIGRFRPPRRMSAEDGRGGVDCPARKAGETPARRFRGRPQLVRSFTRSHRPGRLAVLCSIIQLWSRYCPLIGICMVRSTFMTFTRVLASFHV